MIWKITIQELYGRTIINTIKLILKAYTAGIKFKYERDTIFYDLRTITERYNKITAENSITTQDEQRKVLNNIVDFYCDII